MRTLTRNLSALAASAALTLVFGCGGTPDADSSTTKVSLSGTVRYAGKAAEGGSLSFDPANINRKTAPAVTAEVNALGAYRVETLTGGNRVSYTGKDPKAGKLGETYVELNAGQGTLDLDFAPGPDAPKVKK